MHRDIRWPNVIKYKKKMAWFIIDFEYAKMSPCSKDNDIVSKLNKTNHAPEIFTKELHNLSVDIWSIGYLIADAGFRITYQSLDDLKHTLLGTDRPTTETVKIEVSKIHASLCNDTNCSFKNL